MVDAYLYFLYNLFAERTNFGGAGDGHVLRALVLTAHSIEAPRFIQNVAVQVRLRTNKIRAFSDNNTNI